MLPTVVMALLLLLPQSMRAPGLAPSLSTSAAGHLPQASPLRQSLQMPALSHAQHPLARSYPALGMPGLDPALEAASSLERQTSPCKLLGHAHGPASAVALFPHALEGGVGGGPGARRGTRQGDGAAGLRQWLAKLAQARGPPDRTVLAGKPEGRVGWGRWARAQVRGAVAVVADLLLGLLSDGMTPRLLLLTFLVGLMLVMQVMGLLLMVWLTVLRPAAAGSSQGSGPGIATQLPGFPLGPAAGAVGLAGVAGAGQEGVAGLLGWDGAGGVLDRVLAAERGYWQQRLVALTEELGVLQQRVGLVTGELTSALAHLAQQTAMAAAAAAMGAAGGEVAGGSQVAAAAAGGVAGAATDEL
ncbi:hypothetical protein QJQ45_003602 [Haematococcus lacustris]|nr:hypothetical protein QJQ45_003602 [Haematococcus lacustris]